MIFLKAKNEEKLFLVFIPCSKRKVFANFQKTFIFKVPMYDLKKENLVMLLKLNFLK